MGEETRDPIAAGQLETGMAGGEALRWVASDLTDIVEGVRERLDLSPVAAAALGRCLSGAAMLLQRSLKTPARLVLEVRGDGPIRRVLAEADEAGVLRGMVANPRVDLPSTPAGKLPVGEAVGRGLLHVFREREGVRYHSKVELVSGEIGQDLAHYLSQSEQVRSAVLVGVMTRPSGVSGAGGMIVEALPGASPDLLRRLEANLVAVGGPSRAVESGGLEGLKEAVLAGLGPQTVERRRLLYRCRCDRRKLRDHLALVTREERADLEEEDGSLIADCVFCGASYRFDRRELEAEDAVVN